VSGHDQVKRVHFASYYRWIVATRYWALPSELDGPVLDLGANDGYFLSQIQAPVKIALDLAATEQPLSPLIKADARRIPFADHAFRHVFAFDLLEHVSDDGALLADVDRVLGPGGTLWISTPASRFTVFPGGVVQQRLHESWGHVRRGYSAGDLAELLPWMEKVHIYHWNEPIFRLFYLGLKILHQICPTCVSRLIRWVAALDARWRGGESGHLFASAVKPRRETGNSV
jgi:SAM-dependent methyltransferase